MRIPAVGPFPMTGSGCNSTTPTEKLTGWTSDISKAIPSRLPPRMARISLFWSIINPFSPGKEYYFVNPSKSLYVSASSLATSCWNASECSPSHFGESNFPNNTFFVTPNFDRRKTASIETTSADTKAMNATRAGVRLWPKRLQMYGIRSKCTT